MAKKTNFETNGQKYYRIRRKVGHKPDGTPIIKAFYGSGINEANQKADEYINDLKSGLISELPSITINVLLPDWLFGVKKNEVKSSTFESYYGTYKKFIEPLDISNIPIKEVKSLKLQKTYNNLKTTTNNVKKIHKILHMFFGYAEKEGYVIKNPCNNISLPKNEKKISKLLEQKQSFQYYSEEEINKLKDVFRGNKKLKILLE